MSKQRRRARRAPGRPAQGRERTEATEISEPRWLTCVLDAWAEQRATGAPFERVIRARESRLRLGPRDRQRARDLGFALARWGTAAFAALDEAMKAYGGVKPPRREQDRAAVALAALAADLEPVRMDLPAPLDAVLEEAELYGAGVVFTDRPRLPPWLRTALEARFGDATDVEVEALLGRAPVTLAVDERVHSRDEALAALREAGVEAEPSLLSPVGIRCKGRVKPSLLRRIDGIWPMDDGSQSVVLSLGAVAGERILDLCAGGGGKSRLLESLGAKVISVDVDLKRLHTCPDTCGRVLADGARPPFALASFDRVLVDAPCSGTGTLRRAPDRALTLKEDSLKAFAEIQAELLRTASTLVKEDGVVTYATCSLLEVEDEKVAAGGAGLGLVLAEERLLTPAGEGCDGFYIARFRRGPVSAVE